MIALTVNDYVWTELKKDSAFSLRYDSYRTALNNADFIPFFPVEDNLAGDISWGAEPYILYDSMIARPTRNVPFEKHEMVMYTIVGTLQDVFSLRDKIHCCPSEIISITRSRICSTLGTPLCLLLGDTRFMTLMSLSQIAQEVEIKYDKPIQQH